MSPNVTSEPITRPARSRVYRTLAGSALLLWLVGCGEAPTRPQATVVAPPQEAPVEAEREIEPAHRGDAPADLVDTRLFAEPERALARGDWLAARVALPDPVAFEALHADDQRLAAVLWDRYYRARIAFLAGDLPAHDAAVAELRARPLPPRLDIELTEHQLRLAELARREREQLYLAHRLLTLGGHPDRSAGACEDALWSAAQGVIAVLPAQELPAEPTLRGWLNLARAVVLPNPAAVAAAISAWENSYANHPAAGRAAVLREAAQRDAESVQLSLVLPLSGPLAAAGDAVTRGFIAAYYDDLERRMTIDVVDSQRFGSSAEAIAAAADRGASVVVGPLGKRSVAEVLALAAPEAPVLALNRPEVPESSPSVLQLSLAPEDEAVQLAEYVFASGARRALLIRPDGVWGDRIVAALTARWEALGGTLPASARYAEAPGYSGVIRDSLDLDESAARSATLRGLFGEGLVSSGRRRADLDAVFLLTRSGEEARALKPLIDYHYAGDLPVYALSSADSGGQDPGRDRDLEGVHLLAMPWRLGETAVPGLSAGDGGSYDALHALGVDAYRLARRWWQLRSDAVPRVSGLTADFHSDGDGVLRRQLLPAEFARGVLQSP